MSTNENITPNWIAVRIDESEFCDPDFLARCGGKVWGVYLVDTNSVTHCCEPTASYCLTLVDTVCEATPEDPEKSDRLMTELMECTQESPQVAYVHCSVLDSFPEGDKATQPVPEDWAEDGEDRGFEEVREGYCGTPDF